MTDLYETLGVSRDATQEEINAAYRRAAKDAHPDAGGTDEKFNQIVVAKRILTDKDKRAKYDATGDTADGPDIRHAKALEMIAGMIAQLIDMPNAIHTDLVAASKEAIQNQSRSQAEALKQAQRDLDKAIKMRARFKAKPGKTDHIGGMLDARAQAIRETMARMQDQIDTYALAVALLDGQVFDVEPLPQQADADVWNQRYDRAASGLGSIFFPTR